MITTNVNESDGLVKGSLGNFRALSTKTSLNKSIPKLYWIELEDKTAGKATRRKFRSTHHVNVENQWTQTKKFVQKLPVGTGSRAGHSESNGVIFLSTCTKCYCPQVPRCKERPFRTLLQKIKFHSLAHVGLSRCCT